MAKDFLQHVDRLIRARYTLLYVVTWEEDRARSLVSQIADKQQKVMFEWSITDGLRRVVGPRNEKAEGTRTREPIGVLNTILQSDTAAIYVLKDFHRYLESPEIVRQMRDLGAALRRTKKTIVLLSPVLNVPPELEKLLTIVDLPLPAYDDLAALLHDKVGGAAKSGHFRIELSASERDALIRAALGLTLLEAENAFAQAIVQDSVLDGGDIQAIIEEKKQIIRKTEVLEYYDVDDNVSSVGGMDILKDWLRKRVRAFSSDARQYGLPQPRGILLMGVQGCGKSLIAKTIASSWKLPLLRLDMSRIFQGYIGSSEMNMRKAMAIAESIAPVVLWIDEIEKAFSGVAGSGASDSGTTARVVGSFLTWMQEKTAPVFVVATANDVRGLPPELLRKGRLDEVFFVDLPRSAERAEIFDIHIRRKRRNPAKFDVAALVAASRGFSGAEIEQAIVAAMHDSFFDNREVETTDILKSIKETVPLSQTMREQIKLLREWSRDRARPVTPRSAAPKED